MIYTKLKYLNRYKGIDEFLDTAIQYLQEVDLKTLKIGRNEIDADNLFVNRFSYETMDIENITFEAHEYYLDIHIVLSGCEKIGISDLSTMEIIEKDTINDGITCVGQIQQMIEMQPEDILIVFPEDAHGVKVRCNENYQVEKAVMKVRCI